MLLLRVLAAVAVAHAACAGSVHTLRQGGFQRRTTTTAVVAPLPSGGLPSRGRILLQQPAEVQALPQAAEQQPLDLGSPLPFYAALLEPALEPYLPPPEAADERRQALQRLAAQLAPAVDAALNETWEQLGALLGAVEEQVPEGASAAEVAAIQASPGFWAALGDTLNDTTDALDSTLTPAAESAACIVFDSLMAAAKSGRPPIYPIPTYFPTFRDAFVPGFVAGLTRGVLDAALGASPQPAAVVRSFGRRRTLLQAAVAGPEPEDALVNPWPQPEAALLAPLPMPEGVVLAPSGEAQPAAPPGMQGVQNAVREGTLAATQGIQEASQAAAGAVGGAADVAAGTAEAANQLTLAAAQSAAQVAAAVQNLVQSAQAIGQLAAQTG